MPRLRGSFVCLNHERPTAGSSAMFVQHRSAPCRGSAWRTVVVMSWSQVLLVVTVVVVVLSADVVQASISLMRSQCTIQKGGCMYHIRMSHGCAANNLLYATDGVQNDYDERVNKIEKSLTNVRTDHTRRIKELENQLTGLLKGPYDGHTTPVDPAHHGQHQVPDHNTDHTHSQYNKFKLDPDPDRRENDLLNMVHNQFTDLRKELHHTKRRLRDTEGLLTDSRSKLNRTESVLAETNKKLLLTEQDLEETREERGRLRATLHTTQTECNKTKEHLKKATTKIRSKNIEMMLMRNENERLKRELQQMRGLLERTRRMLSEALRKYHELNVRHEVVNKRYVETTNNLIECYKGTYPILHL